MSVFEILVWTSCIAAILGMLGCWLVIRRRNMHLWMTSYVRNPRRGDLCSESSGVDVFLAVCDHFEPEGNAADQAAALQLVERWHTEYPRLFDGFRDAEGQCPQHTFFFPQEEYRPEYLDSLAALCARGYGDVDVHLHHDRDSADALRHKLMSFRDTLWARHGLLRRDPVLGHVTYGFIHGNWALCNSRPDGRWCGVDNELEILLETGCYADFTMPSAPSDTQTRIINSLYYAQDRPGVSKSHDVGIRARVGQTPPDNSLLMVQGPLGLDWQQRKWGLLPRIENADLHGGRPASWSRMQQWLQANVCVDGRPDWLFVKLHTHGCKAENIDSLLGQPTVEFHRALQDYARQNPSFRLHYVTAWEMAQCVHQAEQGRTRVDWDILRSNQDARQHVLEV